MRVLVAPDKFKGSLTATKVADNIATELAQSGADVVTLPPADGMRPAVCTVVDAQGQPRTSTIAVDGATAVIEIANACGLSTLPRGVLAPMTASSYGFGEASRHAIGLGARRLVLALGGSASTDGGAGMLWALGCTFVDDEGQAMAPLAHSLHRIRGIRGDNAIDLRGVEMIVARDVTNPLLGSTGAAAVFGPQKGATISEIGYLEAGFEVLGSAMQRSQWPEAPVLATTPGAGAAGGADSLRSPLVPEWSPALTTSSTC